MVRRTTSALRCSIRLVCSLWVGRGGEGRKREGRGGEGEGREGGERSGREVYIHLFHMM